MSSDRLTEWVIRPGLGLGDLLFGASRYGTIRYLGEPEEVSDYPLGADRTIAWYYWKLGVSAHFDGEDGFRLGTLDIERHDAELFGLRLIGRKRKRVQSLLAPFSLGPADSEEMSHDTSISSLTYSEQSLTLWFHGERLHNIQWNYHFGADDQPMWPPQPDAPT